MNDKIYLNEINPHIRFVNNFSANYDYVQPDRMIYDYEFMYILEGGITIYYDTQKYEMGPSDLFYFCPNVVNHMETRASENLFTHCIHFDWISPEPDEDFRAEDFYLSPVVPREQKGRIPGLVKRYTPSPLDFAIPSVVRKLDDKIFRKHFFLCYNSFLDASPLGQLKTKQYFWSIITDLYKVLYEKEKPAIHPKIKKAIQYMNSNYTKDITSEKLAQLLQLSAKYLGAEFKKGTGSTISEYVHLLRMYHARQMLVGSTLSIQEIADLLGYSNGFYFSNKFKQFEGVSPLKYREENLKLEP